MTMRRLMSLLACVLILPVSMARVTTSAGIPAIEDPGPLQEIKGLIDQGHFAEAEDQARRLRVQVAAEQGADSLLEARVIDLLVEALWRGGKGADPEALELARSAVSIKTARRGADHPDVGISLRHLGRIHEILNQTSEAIEAYERALALFREHLGPQDAEVGRTQTYLGNLYLGKGRYDSARSLFENALTIFQKVGPENRVAWILHNLGILTYEMGDFEASAGFYRKALDLKTRLGPESLDVSWTLNGMALLDMETGEFAEARSLLERALSIREEALGPDHIYVAQIVNNLGYLLHLMGDYAEAGRYLEKALTIERAVLGEEAPDTAMTLLNMARVSRTTGDFAPARRLFRQALAIREKTLGDDDPVLADTLREIAAFQSEREEYATAEAFYRRALDILRRTPQADTSASSVRREKALVLNGFARLLFATNRLREARDLYDQALEIRENAFGPDHPTVAESLEGQALVLAQSGDPEGAESANRRAILIYESSLGPTHPLTGKAYRDLGILLARSGDPSGALDALLAAERIGREHLRLTSRFLSDRQALLYASVRTSGLDEALGLAAGDVDRQSRRRVWESLIRSRAAVLDEMASRRRSLAAPAGRGEVGALFAELSAASRRLANLYVRGPDPEDPDRHYRLLEEARRNKEAIERSLAEKSAEFRREQVRAEVKLDEVTRALPQGSALVAYARYDARDKPSRYMAFIAGDGEGMPRVVALGEVDEVDRRIAAWTAEVTDPTRRAARDGNAVRTAGEAVRRAVWDPIAAGLGDASPVFVVPDGMLNLVNFSALPDGKASYLVETGPTFHYLSAEREILQAGDRGIRGEGLLAMGGPAFDLAGSHPDPDRSPGPEAARVASVFRGQHSVCSFFQGMTFPPLPGSLDEVADVCALWPRARSGEALQLTGAAATEAAFKAEAPGRRAIHLATHGFYLDGSCSSAVQGLRGVGGLRPAAPERPVEPKGENPLLLAGLALAGANHRATAQPDQEDGILTAEEIASLDLHGVEWVVLSACHTGVGEIRTGEGVLGLRRAFQVAGARTLIMSLWPVQDEATRSWMQAFYEGRFGQGLGAAEAVRRASLLMMNRLREGGQPPDPFTWAAFVASGDWR